MLKGLYASIARHARFLVSLVPAFVLLLGFLGVVAGAASRLRGGVGLAISIIAAICLLLGVLLAYQISVDWLNLRVIRSGRSEGNSAPRDGRIVAFSGVVRVDAEPMTSPLSATPSAAYTYIVGNSKYSSRYQRRIRSFVAQGFHLVKTRIEGTRQSLGLRSFPSFEDDLRKNVHGKEWATQARELIDGISETAVFAVERERQARLLEVREAELEEVHQDYCTQREPGTGPGLNIEEEVLPVGQEVCVIGTYDKELNGLTARRSRLGPNLLVYRGSAEEVLLRVGKETAGFAKTAVFLVGIAVLVFGLAFSPAAWTSRLPIIGSLFVAPPQPTEQGLAVEEADPDAAHREQIDGWVREEYDAGNVSRALELAINENAHQSLRWLIDRGVGPTTPMGGNGKWYQLPLVEAARFGHLEAVRILLEAGANPNQVQPAQSQPTTGQTALGESLRFGYCEIANLLVEFGATPPTGLEASRCP